MVNTSPCGSVAQLGEVNVNPLSVPPSSGKALEKGNFNFYLSIYIIYYVNVYVERNLEIIDLTIILIIEPSFIETAANSG